MGATPRAAVSAGLAEIANANFFSEDTLGDRYPSPTAANLIEVSLPTPFGRVRRYFSRPAGLGLLPANPVRAECVTEKWLLAILVRPSPYPCVDGAVWGQVATHMLPRAVGYARGALDYFFRGSMAVTRIEWTRSAVEITVKNTGPDVMEGVFEIHARRHPSTPQERRVKLATIGAGGSVRLEPGQEWVDTIVIPPDAAPTASQVLVFKGRLGLEQDAVAAQVFTVPYVEVRQTSYEAGVTTTCGATLSSVTPPPYRPGETTRTRQDVIRCEWPVTTHHIRGALVTNSPLDPVTGHVQPVIDRIEARWLSGRAAGPAPLVIDGTPVPGVWQRIGGEADPTSFEILDPAGRDKAFLTLLVSYSAGPTRGSVEATLATIESGVSVHSKSRWIHLPAPSTPRYLVTSGRGVSGSVSYNWSSRDRMTTPLFEAVAIGGLAPGADARTYYVFGSLRVGERVALRQLGGRRFRGIHGSRGRRRLVRRDRAARPAPGRPVLSLDGGGPARLPDQRARLPAGVRGVESGRLHDPARRPRGLGLLDDLLAALRLGRGDDLGLQVLGHLLVVRVLHVIGAAPARG